MTTRESMVRERQRFENYKAMFNKAFSYHEGETDPDYLTEWEARLIKQERAYREQGRGGR